MPELADARLKLNWGNCHLDSFKDRIQRFLDTKPKIVRLETKYYPKTQHFLHRVKEVSEFPVEWGLVIGDVLHNYRSALDAAAWKLVTLGTTPKPTDPKQVMFPIYKTTRGFHANINRRLPGVSTAALAVVERRQPYNGWDEPAKLQTLSNDDKHRAIHPIVTPPIEWNLSPSWFQDFRTHHLQILTTGPVKRGTKLLRICGTATGPNPEVDMKEPIRFGISFEGGSPAYDTLVEISRYIDGTLTALESTI